MFFLIIISLLGSQGLINPTADISAGQKAGEKKLERIQISVLPTRLIDKKTVFEKMNDRPKKWRNKSDYEIRIEFKI